MWGSLEGKNDKHQGREDTSSSEVYPVMKTQSGRKGGRKQKKKKQLKQFDQLAIQRESEVAQSCLTLCDPRDCSLPGFSVHGIFQARILEWVTISFSRKSSRPRDRARVSHIGGRCFNLWATREAHPTYTTKRIYTRKVNGHWLALGLYNAWDLSCFWKELGWRLSHILYICPVSCQCALSCAL